MKTILYIEDDHKVCEAIVRFLDINYPQFAVSTSATAELAISYCGAVQFDLIISDYNLAGPGTGGDVLEWLRANQPTAVQRFMFLSGNDEVKKHGYYLEKPANGDDIRAMIRLLTGELALGGDL